MVANIVPVGNGQANRRYSIVFYVFGSVVGGIFLGLLLTGTGLLLRRLLPVHEYGREVPLLLGFFFLLASARETELLKFSLPDSGSQVPRSWFYTLGHWAGAFAWGGYLGVGFLTPVVCISYFAVMLWVMLLARPELALVLTLSYVIGRVMPVVGIRYATAKSEHDCTWYINKIAPFSGVLFVWNGILLAGMGSLLLTTPLYW